MLTRKDGDPEKRRGVEGKKPSRRSVFRPYRIDLRKEGRRRHQAKAKFYSHLMGPINSFLMGGETLPSFEGLLNEGKKKTKKRNRPWRKEAADVFWGGVREERGEKKKTFPSSPS